MKFTCLPVTKPFLRQTPVKQKKQSSTWACMPLPSEILCLIAKCQPGVGSSAAGNTDCQLQCKTKVLGQFPLYPLPPITMLILSGHENTDESIDDLNISTLSGGKGGYKNCNKRTYVSVTRVEVCVVKFSSFRPSLSSVPRSYDLHCSSELQRWSVLSLKMT